MIKLNRKTYFEVFEKNNYDSPIGWVEFKGGEWKFRQAKKDTHINADTMAAIVKEMSLISNAYGADSVKLYKLARHARDVLYQNNVWFTSEERRLYLFMKENRLLAKKDIGTSVSRDE